MRHTLTFCAALLVAAAVPSRAQSPILTPHQQFAREIYRELVETNTTDDTSGSNTKAAEERLRAALGARVEIHRRGRGGALRIAFTGEAELNRLFELLLRAGRSR